MLTRDQLWSSSVHPDTHQDINIKSAKISSQRNEIYSRSASNYRISGLCVLSCILKRRQCFENWIFCRQFKRGKISTRLVPVQGTDRNHWTGFDLLFCVFFISVWRRLLSDRWSWVCGKLCEDRF